ncbi:N-acetyl sugar amidotransferase [Polynucleobacter sp. UB-Raua-W9]|nr:N-acetyl sugar amidotransferase [Polynucleobacter sp. UB-Raua-W9]
MIYCRRCLYPSNHPYGMVFDDHGVCMGCRIHEEKDSLNWHTRFEKLKEIIHRNTQRMGGKGFDCIVPVTGGGDSYFTLHVVKNILGMNPLVVHYNSHFNTDVGIRNLANLHTVFDCDQVTSTISPVLMKKVTRQTLKKFGSMYWQVLAGNSTFPVQMAVKFKIPLIIWGVHGWSEQTGMFSHLDEVEMTERCRKEHALMGYSAEDLLDLKSDLTHRDLQHWVYPSDHEIEHVGVRGIYLNNYLRWDSKTQHELMIKLYGYETALQQRTFNNYEDVHCAHSAGLHDYLKYLRYGYSKVHDHATREIRLKRISREQGIDLVKRYQDIYPDDINIFLEWLEMDEAQFWSHADQWRDPSIWSNTTSGWIMLDSIANSVSDSLVEKARLDVSGDHDFIYTGSQEPELKDSKYILMGRGYVDKYNFGAIETIPMGGNLLPREWKKEEIDLGPGYEVL